MLIINNRYELLDLALSYNIPSIYDILNKLQETKSAIACTDGKSIYINPEEFNEQSLTPKDQFFILAHEMLHIIYKHVEMGKLDKYKNNQELLNICQDCCINEYLFKKLKYRPKDGIFLDTIGEALYNRNLINHPVLLYNGQLTTEQLYDFIYRQTSHTNKEDLFKDIYEKAKTKPTFLPNLTDIDNAISNTSLKEISSTLHITTDTLKNEMQSLYDPSSELVSDLLQDLGGNSQSFSGKTTSHVVNKLSHKELIKYLDKFIGTHATIKGRSRTFNRPNRRINSSEYTLKGYKYTKTIKELTIYLDISGSMDRQLVSDLYSMLKTLYQTTKFNLTTFNVDLHEIDIKNTNYIQTGGGTRINKVLEDIKKRNNDVSIIITDCEDTFSLNNVKENILFFTNNTNFKSKNPLVEVSYFC